MYAQINIHVNMKGSKLGCLLDIYYNIYVYIKNVPYFCITLLLS